MEKKEHEKLIKQLENEFISKLLTYSGKNLSSYYARRVDFLSGKSLDYCRIGRLQSAGVQNVKEFESAGNSFHLGVEFGINISIDAFSSWVTQSNDNSEALIKLLRKSRIKKNDLLPKEVLRRLKKSKRPTK